MKTDYDIFGESDAYSRADVDFAARGFGCFVAEVTFLVILGVLYKILG